MGASEHWTVFRLATNFLLSTEEPLRVWARVAGRLDQTQRPTHICTTDHTSPRDHIGHTGSGLNCANLIKAHGEQRQNISATQGCHFILSRLLCRSRPLSPTKLCTSSPTIHITQNALRYVQKTYQLLTHPVKVCVEGFKIDLRHHIFREVCKKNCPF